MANMNEMTRNLETLVKGGLEEAQKRFQGLETEADKLVKSLKPRVEESRKEVEALLAKLDGKELTQLLEHPRVKELSRKATQTGNALRKRLDGLQNRVVESTGVASQAQVKEIRRELSKLTKKIDELVGGATAAVTNGAAHLTGKKASASKSDAPRV
jgi:ElaB/YqjD/DUF883 family membrane-anchored ribosome-binding protein